MVDVVSMAKNLVCKIYSIIIALREIISYNRFCLLVIDDEKSGLELKHSKRYILQMANSGPDTNGSQFCFMLAATPHLNGHHVVFGEVVAGFNVVDQMEAAGVEQDGIPLQHKVVMVDGGEIFD